MSNISFAEQLRVGQESLFLMISGPGVQGDWATGFIDTSAC